MRDGNRENTSTRPIKIQRNFTKYAPGSVLIEFGDTKVICTASIEEKVPPFLRFSGKGWLTAEYSMLPSSTGDRVSREVKKGKPSGRTSEIQRLIGRSLRGILDLELLGERTIYIDADVIQADGGTRTASISGAMVALADAVDHLLEQKLIDQNPIKEWIAAISVGKFNNQLISDLCYAEDSNAELDMNVVMTESGQIIEIQGTAEKAPFSIEEMNELVLMAKQNISDIISVTKPVKSN